MSESVVHPVPEEWAQNVYKPDILGNPEKIYKKPGYDPFA